MPISGTTPVTAKIAPTSSSDAYATHDDIYGKGGYRTVVNITARNNIATERRSAGMLVYVTATDIVYKLGSGLSNTDWVSYVSSGGSYVKPTLAAMRAIPSDSGNVYCVLLGNTAIGDGGGGQYYWDNAGTAADSPMIVIRPNDFGSSGIWIQV